MDALCGWKRVWTLISWLREKLMDLYDSHQQMFIGVDFSEHLER